MNQLKVGAAGIRTKDCFNQTSPLFTLVDTGDMISSASKVTSIYPMDSKVSKCLYQVVLKPELQSAANELINNFSSTLILCKVKVPDQ